MMNVFVIIIAIMLSVFFFFLSTTSLSLLFLKGDEKTKHIYWIYRKKFLMKLVDWTFIPNSILLFQYNKINEKILSHIKNPQDKNILQISCAYGNFTKKLARHCKQSKEVHVLDIIPEQVDNVEKKLQECEYSLSVNDAADLPFKNASYDYSIIYMLFHELPDERRRTVLLEAMRVTKGVLLIAFLNKPKNKLFQLLGKLYFSVFERHARDMWDFNLIKHFKEDLSADWLIKTESFLNSNYKLLIAEKKN